MYNYYRNVLRLDRGSVFKSDRWRNIANLNGIQLLLIGAEPHSFLGIGERLHISLRRIYQKTDQTHPNVPRTYAVTVALKAINDRMGENMSEKARLVFGIILILPIRNVNLHNQCEKFQIISKA